MLNKVLGRVRLTLKALMLDSMRQGMRSRGRRNAARARTNLSSIFGGFSTAVGNQRRSQLRRAAACESLEFRVLLTTWNIGLEAIFPGSVDQFTTIYPTNDDGTGANITIFWGGDHPGFSDSFYFFDANGGTGQFSSDLGTNPFIKFTGSTGNDIVRNNSGNGVGDAVDLTAYGYGGNDEFYGGQEYDKLFGGLGNDKLYGGDGDDVLYGGEATDNDELYGGTGEDRFYVANDGTNSGKDQVKDKRGLDSRIHFVDTTVSEVEFDVTWNPKAWTDSEIEVFDVVLNDFHDTTGNERLNQESNVGGDLYFRRLGTNSSSSPYGAWSDGTDTSTYPDNAFAGGDSETQLTVVHEVLGHNYDRPTTNKDATAFQAISGWTKTVPASSISYAEWTAANPGFVKSDKNPHNGWYFNPGNNTKPTLFARDYGASAPFEDFATTAEAWYASEYANSYPGYLNPLVELKQANLQLLFNELSRPTTPTNLEIDQTVINRPVFTWESLVADEFHVQIKDASNNVIREEWTAELTFPLTADLPAGKYTFLVSSTIDTEEESLMTSLNFTVNHAPEWVAGVQPPAMAGQNEDHLLAYGTTVLSLTAAASDVDAGAKKGIAVFYTTGLESGSWQFTTNGGVEWNTFASVGFPRGRNNALLLPANGNLSRVRFVPNKDYNGNVQLGYYAWDQTQGTAGSNFDISSANKRGGITAFSTGTHVSTLTVSPVNDAPVWAAGPAAALIGINEDNFISSGTNISSLTSGMTDVDASAKKGIAVYYTSGLAYGFWQFTTDGGAKWSTFASSGFPRGRSNALLLPANGNLSRVRFVPNKDYNDNVQLGYYAWDQTQGTAGGNLDLSTANKLGGVTAFSTGTHVSTLTVSPVNDAPVWAAGPAAALIGINEDNLISSGTNISSLTSGMTDVDAGAKKGIAVYYTSGLASGSWQFTTDGGAKWSTFASPGFPRGRSNALLLPANGNLSRVRFVPEKDFNGSVQLGYFAWDQTQGTAGRNFDLSTANKLGGATAFSTGFKVSTLAVGPVSDAPEWVAGTPAAALIGINEDNFTSSGTTIATLASGMTDVDADAKKGIAVYYTSGLASGSWQFTTDGGAKWSTFASLGFPRGRNNALLLPANGNLSRVRFVPNKDYNGNVQLGYYAWDQTQGTAGGNFDISTANKLGGITAFSTGTHVSTLTVSAVNDAPKWVAGKAPALNPINEDDFNSQGTTIASITAGVLDVDANRKKGIAVFQTLVPLNSGRWEYTLNGGKTWVQFGGPSNPASRSKAMLLPANGDLSRIRFLPFKDFNGSVKLGYYAWDQTQGTAGSNFDISTANKLGGATAFSTDSHVSTLTVTPVNDAPVWIGKGNGFYTIKTNDFTSTGTPVQHLARQMRDVDFGLDKHPSYGIAVVSAPNANGKWQFSQDTGRTWTDFPVTSPSNALLLSGRGTADRVRFVPNRGFSGDVRLDYYAWDGTQGAIGSRFDVSNPRNRGGITAFSSALQFSLQRVEPV